MTHQFVVFKKQNISVHEKLVTTEDVATPSSNMECNDIVVSPSSVTDNACV